MLASQSELVKHVKSKGTYFLLAGIKTDKPYREDDHVTFEYRGGSVTALLQSSTQEVVPEGTWLLVYYREAGIWCREVSEFNDGRFVSLD